MCHDESVLFGKSVKAIMFLSYELLPTHSLFNCMIFILKGQSYGASLRGSQGQKQTCGFSKVAFETVPMAVSLAHCSYLVLSK